MNPESEARINEALRELLRDAAGNYTHWKLDGHEAVPATDYLEWANWFGAAFQERIVKQEQIGPYYVSTVFLGLNHRHFGDGPPILFETMVFAGGKQFDEVDSARCSTWEQAEAQHERTAALVRLIET